MTYSQVEFENFEDANAPRIENPDFLRGYESGQEEAALQSAALQAKALSDIAATLADMSFGFTEAKVHLTDLLRPLLTQVAQTALPEIAKDTFGTHLVDVIMTDFDTLSDTPLSINVSPDVLESLSAEIPQDVTARFTFTADPTLAAGQAILTQADTHIIIDLPGLIETLQTALSGLDTNGRTTSNAG